MKKSILFLVLVLTLTMLLPIIPIQAYESIGEPIADYDKYGYYAYYDFESYGTSPDHRKYMESRSVENADGLLCNPFGLWLENGGADGTGKILEENDGNKYYHYTTNGKSDYNVIAVFGMKTSDGIDHSIGEATEVSFKFRMGASDTSTANANDRIWLIVTRRGSAGGAMEGLTTDIYGNLYARINGSMQKIYTNGDGKTVGGDGKFMDIVFRWYDVTNTYSLFLNGKPLVEAMPLHMNYRSSTYVSQTYNDDFGVESRNAVGSDKRYIEVVRSIDTDGSKYTYDVDDIKLSRVESAQRGAVYYENSFDGTSEGISLISTRSTVYSYATGASSSNITRSAADSEGNRYLNVKAGQYVAIDDRYYNQFTQGNTVIEFSIKGKPTHTSGKLALMRFDDGSCMNVAKFLYVDNDGILYTTSDDNTRINGYRLDGTEWLDIAVVIMKNTDKEGKFGSFNASSTYSSNNDKHRYFFSYYINGNFVGSSYFDAYEWNGVNSWVTDISKNITTHGYQYTIIDYKVSTSGALALESLTLVDSTTTANHKIYKTADSLTYYDVTFDASGNQTAYSAMVLTKPQNLFDEGIRILTKANFNASLDNIRIYEGTAPDFAYKNANSESGGNVVKVDFASVAFPNYSDDLTARTHSSGSNVLGTFISSGVKATKVVHKDANGNTPVIEKDSEGKIIKDTIRDSYYSTLNLTSGNWFDLFVPMPEKAEGVYDFAYSYETTVRNIGFKDGDSTSPTLVEFFSQRFEKDGLGGHGGTLMSVDNNFNIYAGANSVKLYNADGTEAKINNSNWNTLRADVHYYQDSAKTSIDVDYYLDGELLYLASGKPAAGVTSIIYSGQTQRFGTSNFRLRYTSAPDGKNLTIDVKDISIIAKAKPVYTEIGSAQAKTNDKVTIIELNLSKYSATAATKSYEALSLVKTSGGVTHTMPVLSVNPITNKVSIGLSGKLYELCTASGKAITLTETATPIAVVYNDINGLARYYVNGTIAYINLSGELVPAADLSTYSYSFTQLGSVSSTGYVIFSGYGSDDVLLGENDYNLVIYNVNNADTAEIVGLQHNQITDGIRIIAGVDTLYYSKVGFEMETFVDGVSKGTKDLSDNVVFSRVVADDRDVTAASAGYNYFAAIAVTELPANISNNTYIILRSYADVEGVKHYDKTLRVNLNKDGYYFDEDGVVYQNNFDDITALPSEWKTVIPSGGTGSVSMSSDGGILIDSPEAKNYIVYLDKYVGPNYVLQADMTVKQMPASGTSDPQFGINFGYTTETPVKYGRIYIANNRTSKFMALFTGGKGYDYTVENKVYDPGTISVGKTYTITLICTEGKYVKYFVNGKLALTGTFKDGQGYDQKGMISFFSKGFDVLVDNVIVRTPDSVTVNGSTIETFEIKEKNETSTRIRAATFNIGDFSTYNDSSDDGTGLGNGTETTKEKYKDVFEKVDADIWGLQEDSQYFNGSTKESAYDAIYKYSLPYHKNEYTGIYNSKAFLSAYEIYGVQRVYYPKAITSYAPNGAYYSHEWFLAGKINVDGIEIALVSLHFDWACKERRAYQIASVIEYAKQHEYCIIMGDFNPQNCVNGEAITDPNDKDYGKPGSVNMYQVDWKYFTDEGFVPANGGKFGVFETMMQAGKPYASYPWDNIFISSNMKFINVEVVYEPWMNDHAIVVADIEIK